MAGLFDDEELTYTRKVSDEHYMRKEHGYGIQEDICAKLMRRKCKSIVLETRTGKFEIPFHVWIKEGKRASYGHGEQIFCNEKFYRRKK